jgi:hypothetical protein
MCAARLHLPQGKQLCVLLNKSDLLQRGASGQLTGSPEQVQQLQQLQQELEALQRDCSGGAEGTEGAGSSVQLLVLHASAEKGYGMQQLLQWLVAGSQEPPQAQKAGRQQREQQQQQQQQRQRQQQGIS